MVVRSAAAPPTPWSKDLAEPKIHESAYVHSFSNLIGDVTVCENVLISPGTSIRADEGAPFYIGSAANIQDGVVIHGLEQGRVVGADGQDYSVWIGDRSCITHMALIHGPAYIGNDCFIGFRSTVFNARIGDGCVIMMHALIQDVDIPPGKYVPSGAVITSQQQVERLSNVTDADRVFAKRVIEINGALLGEAPNSSNVEPTTDQPITPSSSKNISGTSDNQSVGNMSSNGDLYNQVRGLAAQGCTFTAEHANKRRFKTKSWLSAGFVEGRSADQIIANLSRILANHAGEYVQLIAVDPNSKSRSAEIIVQRPGDNAPIQAASGNAYSAPARSSGGGVQSGAVSGDLTSQIRSFAAQGCTFTAEHANKRRFKTKSWLSAGFVEGHSAEQIIANVSALLGQYAGEYVQLIAVDPNSKSRVAEIIVQRPGETTTLATGGAANTHRGSGIVNTAVGGDVASQIAALASQGCTFTAEHASTRRFKTQSWLGAGFVDGHSAGQILGNVQAIAGQFPNEYVQLIAVDPSTKTRVAEIIVQRPGNSAPTQATSNTTTSFASSAPANTTNIGFSSNHGGNKLTGDVVSKVRSLLMQGYKIGTEHADKRRFRVKSWSSCGTIDSTQENEVLRRLETCLQDHSGEYVRLIGVDEAARRRVLEEIIQRP